MMKKDLRQNNRAANASNCARALIALALLLLASNIASAQSRYDPNEVVERVESRPGLEQPAHSSRYTAMEYNQRYGVQQVGEVMASAIIEPIARKPVNQPENFVSEAMQLAKAGKYQQATQIYKKALKLQPNLNSAHQGLGFALLQLNDFDSAIEQFKEVATREPNNAEAHVNLGVAYYRGGHINEAIAEYQRALTERKGPFPDAHFNLAMAFAHSGDFDQAVEHYKLAIEQRNKNYPEACNNLGLVYEAMGNSDAAMEQFNLAITESRGHYALANYNIARYYEYQKNYAKAIDALQLAIKDQADFPEAYLNLGAIYLIQASLTDNSNPEQAVAAYKKALQLRDDYYPLAHEGLAIALTMQGNRAAAISEYRIAFDQFEGNCPETLRNLIATLLKKESFSIGNELSRANNAGNLRSKKQHSDSHAKSSLAETLQEYADLDDDLKAQADIRYCAGKAYLAARDWPAAADELDQAVKLSQGKDADAAKTLKFIISLLEYF
jgi:tetratricopeptide (TPR) repeat protein